MGGHGDAALPHLIEDLFRHRYGRMVAGLTRVLGPSRLDLVEDVRSEPLDVFSASQ